MYTPAFAKPLSRRVLKGRDDRHEAAVKRDVRALVVARDGSCRLSATELFGPCRGPSEWAHLFRRRSHTVGEAPELRHSTRASVFFCRKHHAMEETRKLKAEPLTLDGADGRLRFSSGQTIYDEPA